MKTEPCLSAAMKTGPLLGMPLGRPEPAAVSKLMRNGHAHTSLRGAARGVRRLHTIRRFCAALRHCAAPLAAMSSSFKLEDDDELALWLGKKITIDDLIPSMLTSQL